MDFSDFNYKLQGVISDLEAVKVQAVELVARELTEINKEQLLAGETSKGQSIAPSLRSFQYALEKKAKGGKAPAGIPDMKNTGAFQRAMFLVADPGTYEIGSTDDKYQDLTEKYADIMGIADKNQAKAHELTTGAMAKVVKEVIGL